jgi:hypothetical protein
MTLAVSPSPYHRGVPVYNMPNDIPDSQIREFLATNTKPVIPTDSADMECPICHVPYASPPQTSMHPNLPSDEEEYAVKIQNKAECKHSFGRRCLEDHIRGGNPWSHTCPFCRTEWLPAPNDAREDARKEVEWERVFTLLADAEQAQGLRRVGRSLEELRDAREELERLFALLETQDAEQARQELRRVGSSLERLRDVMDEESRSI